MFASLATLAHKLSTRLQRYIISLKNKVEYSIVFQLPLDSNSYVSGIIFGLRCEESTKSIVRKLLAGHSVSYYQMEVDYDSLVRKGCYFHIRISQGEVFS